MRRSFVFPAVTCLALMGIAGALFAGAAPPSHTPSETLSADGLLTPRTRAVISGEYAYLLGMPETVVADARIDKIVASPTEDAVLIAVYKRHPFRGIALSPADIAPSTGELDLVYWDTRTRTSKTLLRETINETTKADVVQIGWLPETRSAFIVLNRVTHNAGQPEVSLRTLLRADTSAGTISRLVDMDEGRGVSWRLGVAGTGLEISPSQPLAYDLADDDSGVKSDLTRPGYLRVFTAQGLRSRILLPGGVYSFTWLPDGKSIYADRVLEKTPEGKYKVRKALTVVNLQTGAVTQPDTLPIVPKPSGAKQTPSPRESWAIDIATANAALQNPAGKAKAASALWLQAIAPPKKETATAAPVDNPVATNALLIATNARPETLLATETSAAVLFTRDGSLCVAPVFRLPALAFETALRGIQRTATMTNAKQVGVALMAYSQDYDENLPLPGDGVKDAAGPYLKNPSVFENPGTGDNGFVYSYGGPTGQAQITSPATTQLGYVSGPGGRAIIWADGHVTWVDG